MLSQNRPARGLLLITALFFSLPASAQSQLDNRSQLSFGVFVTDQDTSTDFEANVGDGSNLNFERDLGLEASLEVFRFDGALAFGERHGIYASVFDLSRDATSDITVEVDWLDLVIPIDTRVATDLDLSIYKLAYGYDFMRREDRYATATIGLYTADLGLSLVNLDNQEFEAGDVTAPLPVIGVRGGYAPSDRWTFYGSAEYFAASFEDIDGSIIDVSVGVDYWMTERFAFSLGYNYVKLEADARDDDDIAAELVWDYSGAILAFKFGF